MSQQYEKFLLRQSRKFLFQPAHWPDERTGDVGESANDVKRLREEFRPAIAAKEASPGEATACVVIESACGIGSHQGWVFTRMFGFKDVVAPNLPSLLPVA